LGPYDCPDLSATSRKGWIAAAVLVPIVIIALIVAFAAMRSETLREKLPFLKIVDTWKIGYSGVSGGHDNRLMDEEEEVERDSEDFSIQAEEIEEDKLENLQQPPATSPPSNRSNNKNDALISMDDIPSSSTSAHDDFNPRN